MQITSNKFEHSLTVDNLEIVALKDSKSPELIIAFKSQEQEGEIESQVILTPEQALALRTHLNSRTVERILFGEPFGIRI
jgi:Spy/CpxP family protein refolding chaperone